MTNFTDTSDSITRFAQTLRNVGMDDGKNVAEQVLEIARKVEEGELSMEDAEQLLENMARSMAESLLNRTPEEDMDGVLESLIVDNAVNLAAREYRKLGGEDMDEGDIENTKGLIQMLHLQKFVEAAMDEAMNGFHGDDAQRNVVLDFIVRATTMGVAKIIASMLVGQRDLEGSMEKQMRALLDAGAMARAARNRAK